METLYRAHFPIEHLAGLACGEIELMQLAGGLSSILRDSQGIVGHAALEEVLALSLDEVLALLENMAARELRVRVLLGAGTGAIALVAGAAGALAWQRSRRRGKLATVVDVEDWLAGRVPSRWRRKQVVVVNRPSLPEGPQDPVALYGLTREVEPPVWLMDDFPKPNDV